MDSSRLAARVESFKAEMAYYRGEIEELNTQICSLSCAISNLQEFCFDQLDDKDDSEHASRDDSEETAENSEGNPNESDDASDGGSD
ncbi:hypothetical protein RHMOL_Rhmol04G0217700 [Rhododendron molle]|uniref:Uncharacterized protein n=1 Tax=Rhododendron molle TaxID=49168 RepID=A0ACC0P436_RHOML|nr:hypothetical protein RHMOL_Rhmol04G0217700 [Rhododendron molle]